MCRKEKTFVAGGAAGKLLLNKKGWLGHDEIVLHKGEGPVSAIAWRLVRSTRVEFTCHSVRVASG